VEIKRREFLKLLGGASGAIALGSFGCNQFIDVPDKIIEIAKNGAGIESWKNTICTLCPGGCGIKVRLIDGIPVYIKGNPIYPVNQGGMCPLGHSALELLFNPDRVKSPLKRIGLPAGGKWESLTWDEALNIISKKLIDLRGEGKPHQVAFLDGSNQHGLMKDHIDRFMQSFGSPNYFQFPSIKNDAVPYHLLQGNSKIPSYDFLNAKYVLSFGVNYLEESYSPVYYTKLYSHLRESSEERRTRFVHIDSRMSLTSANADRWIPIKPGTYGALALGIAFVLIKEKLIDANFIRSNTYGYEDWVDKNGIKHLGYKNNVLANYYPERVFQITGVPSETILELARELGNNNPSLVLGGDGSSNNTNGTFSQMAVHSLNALLGNFEKAGGIFYIDEAPMKKLPDFELDEISKQGIAQPPNGNSPGVAFPFTDFSMQTFTQNVLAEKPYPISMLFIYKGNPLFQTLNHRDFVEALKKIPLVVSFDSFINETNEYANIILPDHTFLEQWNVISNVPSVGFSHIGIQQPVIDPVYDTRSTADILIQLGNEPYENNSKPFPFGNYVSEIKYRMEGVYNSGEGAIVTEGVRGSWLEFLSQRGWHIGTYDSFDEFWDLLLERGGWWNPIRKKKEFSEIFNTPTGKFEFYSHVLKNRIDGTVNKKGVNNSPQDIEFILGRLNITTRGDAIFLPHHEPIPYDDGMPIYLTTFQPITNRDGHASNLPLMQEMFGFLTRNYWNSWVELNPETASTYGISDDDWVWIESVNGSIKVKAKVHPGVVPSVAVVPFGLGHTSYGRYAKNHGVNPNTIMKNLYDTINGMPATQSTKVKISRAK